MKRYMKGKNIISITLIFTFLITLVGCGSKTEDSSSKPKATGFQWEVSKGNKKMFLVGTMHPINESYDYFTDAINKVIEEGEVLGLEINPTEEDSLRVNAKSVYSNGETIENHLNKEQIEKLKDIAKAVDMDYDKLKLLKPEIISNNINAGIYAKAELAMKTFD